MSPTTCMVQVRRPKNSNPKAMVSNGTSELSIPASELSILVWAAVKRKAGIPLPKSPTTNSISHSLFEISLNRGRRNGKVTSQALPNLQDAICVAEKTTRPLFMRMNELPQMIPMSNKSSQLRIGFCMHQRNTFAKLYSHCRKTLTFVRCYLLTIADALHILPLTTK